MVCMLTKPNELTKPKCYFAQKSLNYEVCSTFIVFRFVHDLYYEQSVFFSLMLLWIVVCWDKYNVHCLHFWPPVDKTLIMSMSWSIFGSTVSEYSYTIVVFPTQFSFSFFGSSSSFIVWVYFSLAAIVSDTAMYVSVRHFCVSLFSFFVDIRSYLIESPYHSYGSRPVFVFLCLPNGLCHDWFFSNWPAARCWWKRHVIRRGTGSMVE